MEPSTNVRSVGGQREMHRGWNSVIAQNVMGIMSIVQTISLPMSMFTTDRQNDRKGMEEERWRVYSV